MKKAFSFLLTAAMLLSLCACGNNAGANGIDESTPHEEVEVVVTKTETKEETTPEVDKDGYIIVRNPVTKDSGRTPKGYEEYWNDAGEFFLAEFLMDHGMERKAYKATIPTPTGDKENVFGVAFIRCVADLDNAEVIFYDREKYFPVGQADPAMKYFKVSASGVNTLFTELACKDDDRLARKREEVGITEDKFITSGDTHFGNEVVEGLTDRMILCHIDDDLYKYGMPIDADRLTLCLAWVEAMYQNGWDIPSGDTHCEWVKYAGKAGDASSLSCLGFGERWMWPQN